MPHIDSFSPNIDKLKALGAKRAVINEANTQVHKALRVMNTQGTSDDAIDRAITHLTKALDYLQALRK